MRSSTTATSLALARHQLMSRTARQNGPVSLSTAQFHMLSRSSDDSDERQEQARMKALPSVKRTYHSSSPVAYKSTPPVERSPVFIALGLGSISAGAYAASSMVQAYNQWQASRPEIPPEEESTENTAKSEDAKEETTKKEEKKKSDAPRENIFSKWFDVGGKYYEGGFEDTMTRREAALILGVRESSNARRIKDAHRKLLILNHPDTGGSTYLSGKLNEAKELLLKGKAKM